MRREVRRSRLPVIISLLSGAFALLAAPAAFAGKAQVCVDPDSSKCFATIQEGVDAAQGGQTIGIAKGEYFENVVITTVALRLKGSGQGKTVLRGDPNDADTAGRSLTINNNSVVIEKMTIRGGGVSIASLGAGQPVAMGVVLDDVEVTDVLGTCIVTRSDQTFIRNSTIGSCTGACIATGVFSTNKDTEIIKNEIGPCGTSGLAAGVAAGASRSNSMVIDKNDFIGAADSCINVRGESNTITRNDVALCGDIGIASVGTDPLIERNSVASTGSDGILQNCFLPARPGQNPPDSAKVCSSGTISKNDVEETVGIGIHVPALPGTQASNATPIVLEKNSVENAVGGGMSLLGNGMVARKNSAKDSGSDRDTPCFAIVGNDNVVESNTGDGCAGNGFTINGDRNNLNKNKANRNQRIGFQVVAGNPGAADPKDSEDNVLSENDAKKNGIYGFVVSLDTAANRVATNTVLNDDKASGNLRADLCDAGVNTTINGGKYKVIGELTPDGECFSW
jgi:hypothetical protein